MCTNRAWGTVCLNSYWRNNDAIVACHELGYSAYGLFNSNITYKMISFQLYLKVIPMRMAGQMRSILLFSLDLIVLVVKLD